MPDVAVGDVLVWKGWHAVLDQFMRQGRQGASAPFSHVAKKRSDPFGENEMSCKRCAKRRIRVDVDPLVMRTYLPQSQFAQFAIDRRC